MPEISCLYIYHDVWITFIKFENYTIVRINENKMITLSNKTFKKIPNLQKFYVLSWIFTRNFRELHYIDGNYCISIVYLLERTYYITLIVFMMNLMFRINILKISIYLTADTEIINLIMYHRNLLNKREPKRETSNKKIKKFIKSFNKELPKNIIGIYINTFIIILWKIILNLIDDYT